MTPDEINAIEAQWNRLGILMQMAVPDAAEVERQYAACLETVPVMIEEIRRQHGSPSFVLDTADEVREVELGGEG